MDCFQIFFILCASWRSFLILFNLCASWLKTQIFQTFFCNCPVIVFSECGKREGIQAGNQTAQYADLCQIQLLEGEA